MKKIIVLLFILISVSANARIRYVSPRGNNANSGRDTSSRGAWATWQKGFAEAMPGDTIYFMGGVYYSIGENTIDPEREGGLGGPVGHSGTADNPILYSSYPGQWAILDCIQHCERIPDPGHDIYNSAIYVAHVRNITFKDFEVRNVFQCDSVLTGAITSFFSCYMTFDHIVLHNVGERGFQVESGAYKTFYEEGWEPSMYPPYWDFDIDTIRFINCDVYDLCDTLSETIGNGADAFHTSMYPKNVYIWEGCRLWNYSDDGFNADGGAGGLRIMNNCWLMPSNKYLFSGGGWTTERNGFKTGWNGSTDDWLTLRYPFPTEHNTLQVSNSLVLFASQGFREGPSNIGYYHNNTSYKCEVGFFSTQECNKDYSRPSYKNNLVYKTTLNWGGIPGWTYMTLLIGDPYDESHNTWDYANNSAQFTITDSVTVTDADFIGLEGNDTADSLYLVSLFTAPRQADGSLPATKPLTLAPTSDLIDAGTRYISVGTQNVDLTLKSTDYYGSAPDIGYAEYTVTGPGIKPVTNITVTGAEGAKTITADNGTLQLTATVLPSNATNKTVTWSISSGTDKARISSTGLVTALDNGTAIARATANDGSGIYGTLSISISNQVVSVTGITVTGAGGATLITSIGGTLQLNAAVVPANASNKTVTWSLTSGTDKATINASGLVTAIDNGTAIARATANDGSGVYGILTITISNQSVAVASIAVTGAGGATTIATDNGMLQLSAAVLPANATNKAVTWSISSGTDKASISSTGLVTALDNGSATARATANDGSGVSGTLTIIISNQSIAVTSIAITGAGGATTITTDNGMLQLSAAVLPANATNKTVTWSISSGIDKASISSTGLVTALENGSATARAAANDRSGVSGTMTISISNQLTFVNTPPVIVVNFKPDSYSGFVGEINASGSYDANKDNLTYSWTVPNNVAVSSTTGSTIKYLGPIVSSNQTVEFILSISDGKTTQSKVIPIEILPYKPELEVAEISNIEASSYQVPNSPYNVIDGNIGTMWSAEGDAQWLIVELKQPFIIQHVKLSFQPGQRRESYFDILGSIDKVTWEQILTKSASCGFSGDLQVFDFPPSKTGKEFNYIKVIGLGNSTDTWNYISELKIFGYRYRNSDYEKLPVKIYPNPAKERLTLRIDDPTLTPDFIQITQISGAVIMRDEVDPDIRELSIPIDLRNGVYIIQLGSGKLTLFTQKLVVIR